MKNDATSNLPKPKRPPGSFLVFMEDHFRNEFNLKNPNQPAGFASQAGAKQWKQMKDDEKAPFQRKVKELALEYFEKKRCYNNMESQEVNPLPEDVHMHSHEDPQAAPIAGAPPRRLRSRHIPVVPSSSPPPPLIVPVASTTSASSSPQSCRMKTDAAKPNDPNPQMPKRRPGSFLIFM
nr:high mobility group B protein 4-like [Aegilops tauschii subsp. strangulata]